MTNGVPALDEMERKAPAWKAVWLSRLATVSIVLLSVPIAFIIGLFFGLPVRFLDLENHFRIPLFAAACAAASLVFASTALIATAYTFEPLKGRVITKVALAVALMFGFFSLATVPLVKAESNSNGVKCSSQLAEISSAMTDYESSTRQPPPSLQALVDKGFIKDIKVFRCPSSFDRRPIGPHDVDAIGDYYYARLKPNANPDGNVPIVWEKQTHCCIVAVRAICADGHVTSLTPPIDRKTHKRDYSTKITPHLSLYERPPQLPVEFKDDCWLARLGL
jgi:hypothetical protein